ncbi:MAG: SpoIIE family protein phosphatase [Planctomycetota bacterium]
MHVRLSTKLLLFSELVLIVLVAGMIIPIRAQMRGQVIHDMQHELRSVAATAALQIDGELHEQVARTQTADDPAFIELRSRLQRVADANGFDQNNIYTFFNDRVEGDLRFGVMIHEEPFIGEAYAVKEHQAMTAQSGEPYTSNLFTDEFGDWIAAVAPIRNAEGEIVGLLEVAATANTFFARVDNVILVTSIAATVGLILASIAGYLVLRHLVIRPVRTIHRGMLALSAHDFTHRTVVKSGDELEELANTLNQMSNQLNVARTIQAGFVPQHPPEVPGYVFAYRSDPCDATGGDYIDAFDLGNGNVAILVADVTGHGLGPSLIMASCRSALRALAQTGLPPGPLLEKLEMQLKDDLASGRFITMIFGILTPNGTLTYANAGHAPAIVIRDREALQLDSHRPPLGIILESFEGDSCSLEDMQATIKLAPGDRIMLTSDGVNETQDTANAQFGIERIEAMAKRRDLDAHAVVSALIDQVTLHRAGRPVDDDITMLCVDRVALT